MAGKKLGIIITKFENFEHINGIAKAAAAAGYTVQIFMTDEGIRFTTDPKLKELLKVAGVTVSCCDHSCEMLHVTEKTAGITYGSQYDHASLLHDSDRALIF
jgi:peroxiredoxin family protein